MVKSGMLPKAGWPKTTWDGNSAIGNNGQKPIKNHRKPQRIFVLSFLPL
jgi:hypothetical protein